MPIKIRYNTFETNSSSQHTLVLFTGNEGKSISNADIVGGEYGWENQIIFGAENKLNYIAVACLLYGTTTMALRFLNVVDKLNIQRVFGKTTDEVREIFNKKHEEFEYYSKLLDVSHPSVSNGRNVATVGDKSYEFFVFDGTLNSVYEAENYKHIWSQRMVSEDFGFDPYYLYIDHQSSDMFCVSEFAKSEEAMMDFITDNRLTIVTGNDNGGDPLEFAGAYDQEKMHIVKFTFLDNTYEVQCHDFSWSLYDVLYELELDYYHDTFQDDNKNWFIRFKKEYRNEESIDVPLEISFNWNFPIDNAVLEV